MMVLSLRTISDSVRENIPSLISFDSMPQHFWDTIDRLKKLGYSDLDQHLENLMFDTRRLRWVQGCIDDAFLC